MLSRPPASATPDPASPAVRVWLLVLFGFVVLMVGVGGITRLTGSGLSMVYWRPLMGAIPPLSQGQWLEVFAQYQQSPQYEQVNYWMTLDDFRRIFLWEYVHRLLGRLIGIVAVVPWLVFWWRRQMSPRVARMAFVAIILGGAQGGLGWYMVQSGLVNVPQVSHFRLAAHLSLAITVAMWLLWMLLDLGAKRDDIYPSARLRYCALAFVGLCAVQIIYGAFMAGTKAGLLFPTFPDLNGAYHPSAFFDASLPVFGALSYPLAVHYIHRVLGFAALAGSLALSYGTRRSSAPVRRRCMHVLLAVLLQFALGVVTVVWHVPTTWAVLHQLGAVLVLSEAIALVHLLRRRAGT